MPTKGSEQGPQLEGWKGMGEPGLQERWTGSGAQGEQHLRLEGLDQRKGTGEAADGAGAGWELRPGPPEPTAGDSGNTPPSGRSRTLGVDVRGQAGPGHIPQPTVGLAAASHSLLTLTPQ